MHWNQNSFKKIIINVGRIFPTALTSNNQKAYTSFEILTVLLIVTVLCIAIDINTFFSAQYHIYKGNHVVKKIVNLVNFSKNIALINQRDVSICAAEIKADMSFKCTSNWHYPIIIFYTSNKEIILIENNLIHKNENVTLNMFDRRPILTHDKEGKTTTINGTIQYSNLYYNRSIILNKIGRLKTG